MYGLKHCHNVSSLRARARRQLPSPIFNYLEGGSDDEISLNRNSSSFANYDLLPNALTDVSEIRTSILLFGKEIAWPLMLAPTGLNKLFHEGAETAVARAASAENIPYSLSTMGTTTIEDIGQTTSGPKLFQIYVFRDRGLTAELVARAKAARFDGLILTVDTPVPGNRLRDKFSGLTLPPSLTVRSFLSFVLHPRWSLAALAGSKFEIANVTHRTGVLPRGTTLFSYIGRQFDPSLTWKDVETLAREWNGPLVIKGLMSPDDVRLARDAGASSVMVSNHGGRQLDGTPAPIDRIGLIRDTVGQSLEIICDGGVRSGSDVVKALALGANACSIGRPYLYGLAAAGEIGVRCALTTLREELERTLTLMGVNDVSHLQAGNVLKRSPSYSP